MWFSLQSFFEKSAITSQRKNVYHLSGMGFSEERNFTEKNFVIIWSLNSRGLAFYRKVYRIVVSFPAKKSLMNLALLKLQPYRLKKFSIFRKKIPLEGTNNVLYFRKKKNAKKQHKRK